MAMVKGTVSVDDDGNITGPSPGLARELLEARDAVLTALLGSAWDDAKLLDNANVLKAFGAIAEADADAIIQHLIDNAELTNDAAEGIV